MHNEKDLLIIADPSFKASARLQFYAEWRVAFSAYDTVFPFILKQGPLFFYPVNRVSLTLEPAFFKTGRKYDAVTGPVSYYTVKQLESPPSSIFDLSNDERSRLRVVPRFDVPVDSATKEVASLRQPPANVAVQIVLWETNGDFEGNTLHALGLGLKINSPVFRGLTYITRSQLDPRYVRIGGVVATIVRH